MERRGKVWSMVGVSAAFIAGIALAVLLIEGVTLWSVLMLATVVVLALVALLLGIRTMKEASSGFPLEDERTMSLNMRAGYRAFYVSLYSILLLAAAFMFLEDQDVVISNSELMFIVVALMGSIQIIFLSYYHFRGSVG